MHIHLQTGLAFLLGSMLLVVLGTLNPGQKGQGGVKRDMSVHSPEQLLAKQNYATPAHGINHQSPPSFPHGRSLAENRGWIQLGDDIKGRGRIDDVLLSTDGKRLAIFGDAVGTYEWDESTAKWEKLGDDLDRARLSFSGDLLRVAVVRPRWYDIPPEPEEDDDDYNVKDDDSGSYVDDDDDDDSMQYEKPGNVTVYDMNGTSWEIETVITQGNFNWVAQSENGRRVMIGDNDGVIIYDLIGSSWMSTGAFNDVYQPRQYRRMSGNGKRIAVTNFAGLWRGWEWDKAEVRVIEENGSSWSQTGESLEGKFLAMSTSGHRIVTGSNTSPETGRNVITIRIFDWTGSSWDKTGQFILDDIVNAFEDISSSMSSDGRRLVFGIPGESTDTGIVRMYEWDGSTWIKIGGDYCNEAVVGDDDFFGSEISISGNGERVAVGADADDFVRVLGFESTTPTGPFPDSFNEVTCAYTSCIDNLLAKYGERTQFRNAQLAYDKSRRKASRSKSIIVKGELVASLDRLGSAMKWIEILNESAPGFSKGIGKTASTCAINLVEDFINAYQGMSIIDDGFLDNVRNTRLAAAKKKRTVKEWKKSVVKSKRAIWSMMNELGEKLVPLCLD